MSYSLSMSDMEKRVLKSLTRKQIAMKSHPLIIKTAFGTYKSCIIFDAAFYDKLETQHCFAFGLFKQSKTNPSIDTKIINYHADYINSDQLESPHKVVQESVYSINDYKLKKIKNWSKICFVLTHKHANQDVVVQQQFQPPSFNDNTASVAVLKRRTTEVQEFRFIDDDETSGGYRASRITIAVTKRKRWTPK
eukprot:416474_1